MNAPTPDLNATYPLDQKLPTIFERGLISYQHYPVFSESWFLHRFVFINSLILLITIVISGFGYSVINPQLRTWSSLWLEIFVQIFLLLNIPHLAATYARTRLQSSWKVEFTLVTIVLIIGGAVTFHANHNFEKFIREPSDRNSLPQFSSEYTVHKNDTTGFVVTAPPKVTEEQIILAKESAAHKNATNAAIDKTITTSKEMMSGKLPYRLIITNIISSYNPMTKTTSITSTTSTTTPTPMVDAKGESHETLPHNWFEFDRAIAIQIFQFTIMFGVFIFPAWLRYITERRRWTTHLQEVNLNHAKTLQQESDQRLAILRAQVEPHFLFNTLGSVRALAATNPTQAVETIDALVNYLRASIPKLRENANDKYTTVAKELELASAYLKLMQVRMGPRLSFEVNCEPTLLMRAMPPLMLITLVENAIKHGLEPKVGEGKVTIHVATVASSLHITVQDNGVGLSNHLSSGIGLSNLQEQLHTLFGAQGQLQLSVPNEGGYAATIVMPLIESV